MFLSAVILSYNSGSTLERCLAELCGALELFHDDYEVFVVDNGSSDSSRSIINRLMARHPARICPIFFDENTGTTRSRNAALKKSTGRYVLVLDSDAYIQHDAIVAMSRYLDEHPETGIVAPRLSYGSGAFQLSCDVFPTLWHKLKRFLLLRDMEASNSQLAIATNPVHVDYAISACWLIRRDAYEKTGLLDENIFYSPEDVDYCLRIWQSGFKVTYLPEAEVVHDAQELSRGVRLTRFHFSHLWGLLYLMRKHRYFLGRRRLYARLGRQ